jgi:hypothetical protein
MNFFQQISDLKINGDVQIIIRQDSATNDLTVLVHMTNHKAREGGFIIPDLKLNGGPSAIDQNFFEKLTLPVANSINSNIDDFLTQMESQKSAALKKNGVTVTTATKPEPTPQEIRKQKFDKLMAEIDKLISEKKFKEATNKLPKSTDWPEFIKEIADKKSQVNRSANDAFNLFAGSPTLAPAALPDSSDDDQSDEEEVLSEEK